MQVQCQGAAFGRPFAFHRDLTHGPVLTQVVGGSSSTSLTPLSFETIPREAIISARRKLMPLFTRGLVDNSPDKVFKQIVKDQKQHVPAVAGTPHILKDLATGKREVGRFGWKTQIATRRTYSGGAYLNEMGIPNPLFREENAPQGDTSRSRPVTQWRLSRRWHRKPGFAVGPCRRRRLASSARPMSVLGRRARGGTYIGGQQADRQYEFSHCRHGHPSPCGYEAMDRNMMASWVH